jgi:predicted amidohydrolase YtcJ
MKLQTAPLLFLATFAGCNPQPGPPPDLVILNAKVVTIDVERPRAEALAIRDGTITDIGPSRVIESLVVPGHTQVIDAAGKLITPGINDAHTHFGGLDLDYVDLRYVTDPAIITQRVKERVARARPGELIRGGRWDHELFPEGRWPTKELLDPVSPDHPVVLSRVDGHSVLVNSYVLRLCGNPVSPRKQRLLPAGRSFGTPKPADPRASSRKRRAGSSRSRRPQ